MWTAYFTRVNKKRLCRTMYEMYVRVTFNFNRLLQDFRGRGSFFVWPSIYICECELTQRAEGRRRQTLCDKRENNSVWKQFPPNFTFLFVKDQNTVVLIEHQHKHAGNRPVTFVTHKRFAVLFFASSCCVSLLNPVLYEVSAFAREITRQWKSTLR